MLKQHFKQAWHNVRLAKKLGTFLLDAEENLIAEASRDAIKPYKTLSNWQHQCWLESESKFIDC